MTSNDSIDKLFNYIQKLEKRINTLENQEAVVVQGHLESQQPKPLNISLEQLINLYDEVPQVLAEFAVEASLTAQSYRQKTPDTIILELTARGNYWVILLEQKGEKQYYLLPNGNLKLRLYRLETIEYLFNLKGEKIFSSSDFTLMKPTLISIYPSGKQWQLIEKGTLYIGKYDVKKQLLSDLDNMINNPDNVDRILDVLAKINQNNKDLKTEIQSIRDRIIKLEPQYQKLIQIYENEPEHFLKIAGGSQQVKMTQETMNTLLQGQVKAINLELSNEGEYVIKKINQAEYLFPHPNCIFDRMLLNIIHQARLFSCRGEFPIAVEGKDINISKPAQVRQTSDVCLVVEAGEIIF